MLKPKRVLITAGGTREYIDDVRVVTNISTGALGAHIAEEFYRIGCHVHFLHSKQGIMPHVAEGIDERSRLTTHQYVTVSDLRDNMEWLIKDLKMDLVIHSAAVSDFTFKRDKAIKLSSGSPEDFIEYMRKTITSTPKIIQEVKTWDPKVILVGFKFTVGKTKYELEDIAMASGLRCKADLVVANDKELIKKALAHHALILSTSKNYRWECADKYQIATNLVEAVRMHGLKI